MAGAEGPLSGEARTVAEMHATAIAKGCDVVIPGSSELFVDIDSAFDAARFEKTWVRFQRWYPRALVVRRSRSPSGLPFHEHIVVDVPGENFAPLERLVLQAVLGSDPTREFLGVLHLRAGDRPATVFFEKKGTVSQ